MCNCLAVVRDKTRGFPIAELFKYERDKTRSSLGWFVICDGEPAVKITHCPFCGEKLEDDDG